MLEIAQAFWFVAISESQSEFTLLEIALTRPARLLPPGRDHGSRPVIRQFELVERVRDYNPNTDEALLNRAYVFGARAHAD